MNPFDETVIVGSSRVINFIKLSQLGAEDPNNTHINISNVVEVSDRPSKKGSRMYLCNGHTVDIPRLNADKVIYLIAKILE